MALKLINFCAYCNFDPIPYSLVQNFTQHSSSNDSESTYKLLVAALSILVDLSLIFYKNGNVKMNQLVQNLVLLHQKKCGTKSTWYSEVLKFVLNTSDNCKLEKCVINFVEEQKETIFHVYHNSTNQDKIKQLLIKYECQSTLDYIFNLHAREMNIIKDKALKLENNNNQLKAIEHNIQIQSSESETSSDVRDFSIHEAAGNGHLDIIKLLVSHDESLVYLAENDEYKCIPFHTAAMHGHVHILKYFLQVHQVPINVKNEHGYSAIQLAALKGQKNAVSFLLDEDAPIDERNNHGSKVLHLACESSSVETVKLLIAKGIPIDERSTKLDATSLHHAASCDEAAVVTFLIENGAEINAKDKDSDNALHYSARYGYTATTRKLIEKGCSLQAVNNDGNTPLMVAIIKRHLSVVKVFCESGCRPDDASEDGRTPMSVACSNGCKQICEYFLKQFPDLYKRSNNILPAKNSCENSEP